MLIRGPGLAASMSRYLIDRIEATPNIELRPHTELTQLHGDAARASPQCPGATARPASKSSGRSATCSCSSAPIPRPRWLDGCGVALDAHGFVLTGEARGGPCASRAARASLESTVPGVFAVGDVRSGSVKRVGGAIGEGAAVVALIHQCVAARPPVAQPAG